MIVPLSRSEILKSYYDFAYSQINYNGLAGIGNRLIHRSIERNLESSYFPTTVELGSAKGHHLQYVQHKFDEYLMLDLVDFKLDLELLSHSLKNENKKASLKQIVADASQLPFENNSVDRILHTCLLHHVDNLEETLLEIIRVLKPGGIYTGYIPCDAGLTYRIVQALTTTPRIRSWIQELGIDLAVADLRKWEHIRDYRSIERCITKFSSSHSVTFETHPLRYMNFNLNIYSVVRIQKEA